MAHRPSQPPSEPPQPFGSRLDSWKEIAAYLRRDVRTVQRWEKLAGLPVHRHENDKVGSVFAFTHELDSWRNNGANRAAITAPEVNAQPFRWAIAALVFLALVLAGFLFRKNIRRLVRGFGQPQQLTIRKVYEGLDAYILSRISPDGRYLSFKDSLTANLAIRDLATGKLAFSPTWIRNSGTLGGKLPSATSSRPIKSTLLVVGWAVGNAAYKS
jgi:hypothetical protein